MYSGPPALMNIEDCCCDRVADIENAKFNSGCSKRWRTMVVFPLPDGAENIINLPPFVIVRLATAPLFFLTRLSFALPIAAWEHSLPLNLWYLFRVLFPAL